MFKRMLKTKMIGIRIDEDLFNEFKFYCEKKRTTISHEIRQFILGKLKLNK